MADLEDAGFLYQPHTSAGRVPTRRRIVFLPRRLHLKPPSPPWIANEIQREMGGATSAAEITERAGHVLAEVSNRPSALSFRRRWARPLWNTRACGFCQTAA